MTDSDVLVVGGGVGGLVLARRLAMAGRQVTVLEAEQRLGGQVWRHTLDGVDLDAAADSFATRDDSVTDLLRELGLGDAIVLPRPTPAWIHRADGTSAPLPATGVLGIPGNPLAADVIRSIGLPAALRARADALLPARVGADSVTLGELVRRRMGRGVLDGLVAPVVRGVHSRRPEDLPLQTASPRLLALLREHGSLASAVRALRAAAPAGSQVAGIRGGTFRLVDELEVACRRLGVAIETGVRVHAVHPDGVVVDGKSRAGTVVLAASNPGAPAPERRRLTLVTLIVEAPALDRAPRGTGVLVAADAADVEARALTHLSAKWQWIADALPGRHAVRLSYDGEPRDAIPTAVRDASTLLGADIGEVVDADVLAVLRPAPSGPSHRGGEVAAVGEVASGTGLAAVIAGAERTARRLLREWNT